VFEIWKETEDFSGTQLVFCDLSAPRTDGGFSVYADMRARLVKLGIPNTEIAFIHDYESDASKKALYRAVRQGKIRVLLGSTGMMGTGVNVQTRLAALHHLDAPWRPSDVEQRDGRGERQGNLNDKIRIFRYVTQRSFDAYMWQTLEAKAKFIAQVMQGAQGLRSIEDVELATLSYAEIKALASGNPLVMEKAGIDAELVKLAVMKSKYEDNLWENKQELARLPARISWLESQLDGVEQDIAKCGAIPMASRVIEVNGAASSDKEQTGLALLAQMYRSIAQGEKRVIGKVAGFDLTLTGMFTASALEITGAVAYPVGKAKTPSGAYRQVMQALAGFEQTREDYCTRIAQTQKMYADLKQAVLKPFEKAERLLELRQRQREIDEALDLSKGDHAAVEEAALAD
jgi:hypothetical protein